jgi:hypothetical protein
MRAWVERQTRSFYFETQDDDWIFYPYSVVQRGLGYVVDARAKAEIESFCWRWAKGSMMYGALLALAGVVYVIRSAAFKGASIDWWIEAVMVAASAWLGPVAIYGNIKLRTFANARANGIATSNPLRALYPKDPRVLDLDKTNAILVALGLGLLAEFIIDIASGEFEPTVFRIFLLGSYFVLIVWRFPVLKRWLSRSK